MKSRVLFFAAVPLFGLASGYLATGFIPASGQAAAAAYEGSLPGVSPTPPSAYAADSAEEGLQAGAGGSAMQSPVEAAPLSFEESLQRLPVFGEPMQGDDRLAAVLKVGRFSAHVDGREGSVEVVADIAVEFENSADARETYSTTGLMAVRDQVLFSLVAAGGVREVHDAGFDPEVLGGAMMRLLREKDDRIKTVHFVKLTTRDAS
jgi:hypothetical protein